MFFITVMNPPTSETKYHFLGNKPTSFTMPKLPSIRIFSKIHKGSLTRDTKSTDKTLPGLCPELRAGSRYLAPEEAARVQEEEHRQKVVQGACKGSVLAAERRNNDREISQLNHEPLLFGEAETRNSPVRH